MGKRGNREGSLYRRKDGWWVGAVTLNDGKRRTFWARTRHDAQARLLVALSGLQRGLAIADGRTPLGEYLAAWLEQKRSEVRPSTWRRYVLLVRVHVQAALGAVSIAQLTPQHLRQLYAARIETGAAPMSVRHLAALLHCALRQAERDGMVPRNVAAIARPPRAPRREMTTLSPEQARAFVAAAAGDRLEALYVVAITTGMRQGELLGLRWRDVDLENAGIHVRATVELVGDRVVFAEPKTAKSRRQVLLTPTAIAALRRHRARQLEERLRVGSGWEDFDLVFANELGRPLNARNLVQRSFARVLARASVPRIRFHDLRHTAATLLLGRGIHPKIVSEQLGHSQIAVTLDLYSHVTPTMQRDAAAALEAVFSS